MQFDDSIIMQQTLVALRARDKVEEQGKKSLSFTNIMQSSRETFIDFLHRLMSAINREMSDPDAKWVLIEILALKLQMQSVKSS